MYRIYCKVSGGITGTREAYAKDKTTASGYEEYETFEEANSVAEQRMAEMNTGYSSARFLYRAEEV